MIKLILLIATVISLTSCSNNKIRSIIVSNDSSYWDLYKDGKVYESYLFKRNGVCRRFAIWKNGQQTPYPEEDVIYPNTWELLDDSDIMIRGFKRKIIYIKTDSMVLLNSITSDKYFFRKRVP